MQLKTIRFPGLQDVYVVNDVLEDPANPGCFYRTVNGQTQWENPPMVENVEYRTMERYKGKTVYLMLLKFGNLPNNSYKELTMGVGSVSIIDIHGICESAGQIHQLPIVSNNGEAMAWYYTREGTVGDFVQVWTKGDYSNSAAHFFIKYVKEG